MTGAVLRIVLIIALGLLAAFVSPGLAVAQEDEKTNTASDESNDSQVARTHEFEYDSEELKPFRIHLPSSIKVLGLASISGFHVPPGRETGPFLGPPLRIWGNGIGTSLWRDPVTGRAVP
jgi:hypothetical protein